ncbi:16S rRNA pseudouridine(516) synthase [Parashewanella curva]|uniref:Pseudouridine synthase n=1 Tax=Parashewanella curva TaxID=2338552 RepID=A0A3L8Q1X8_9GAMM|nr:16S rRNA pseudouridine(516) synthase [Parashewanella curva]RLV61666.1 16S rRNA pseudouridine(516) synthase [Parashewanella curva]
MQSKRGRLDRYLAKQLIQPKKAIRQLLLQGRVKVDDAICKDMDKQIDEFSHILVDDRTLQSNQPIYIMLHKPVGVVSATQDPNHKTVLDLINHPQKHELHIVGRLDLNTSGLVLLTNDSRWSSQLMHPQHKVTKRYKVRLANPIQHEYIEGFANGFHFEYEGVTTLPAKLEIVAEREAIVSILEGKYHQIKRMFGRYRNPVVELHRLSVGLLELDPVLKCGESRMLTQSEVFLVRS